ncbi:uroporphyrinogen-III C-methyltransferase [Shewanella avicenniae]|uniref:Uroporphyrinogen-III C-methyltransferase n=1 Tax=Shewanella avicenniae TaxID=2814294 RepID=A0ABX7QSZ2_9GAMM|nr:uroporphyrinogen-III C-methyltransferase [Shewanella avicenniae]QSX34061.1 uroporphyrinogen-III C-methyltransferase [Shewanella avicenniae]
MDNEKSQLERSNTEEQLLEHAAEPTLTHDEPQANITETPLVKSESTTQSHSSWLLKFCLFLVALLAFTGLGVSYYLYQQITVQQQQNVQLAADINQAKLAPEAKFSALNNALHGAEQQLSQSRNELEKISESQAQLNSKVATLAQRHPDHWMAAEAEYLVRIAGRKLWLEKDPQTATSLLQAADERIAAMQEPSLVPLRKAIAADINAVSEIKNADIAGTVFTLDGIISKLEKMPLNKLQQADEPAADDQRVSNSFSDWRTNLAKTWEALKEDFFTIRKVSTDVTPLLSAKQEWYLEENIRNKLLQAQLALYQYNELNYRQSITMARKWIQQYYDLDNDNTQEVLKSLEALASLKLDAISVQQFQCSKLLKQLVTYGNLMPNGEVTE